MRWGLLKLCLLISLQRKFSILQKYWLDSWSHFHIWQVSPQLSCGDTCQIWMWCSICNQCFDNNENQENNRTEEIGLVTPPLILIISPSNNISPTRLHVPSILTKGWKLTTALWCDGHYMYQSPLPLSGNPGEHSRTFRNMSRKSHDIFFLIPGPHC